jgi:hypothetical protein
MNCKWWNFKEEGKYGFCDLIGADGHGCKAKDEALAEIPVQDDCQLYTSKNFGCIQHEPKGVKNARIH